MTEAARRSRLFLGSYALLFGLLALRFTTPWLEILCGFLAVVGFGDMVRIAFFLTRKIEAEPIKLALVSDAGSEVSGYLASYLLPFVIIPEPPVRDIIGYSLFLLVTGLIYIRSDMTRLNPTLYLLGSRVLYVETDGGWKGHLVARSHMQTGSEIRCVNLNAAVRVEVRR